MVQPSSSEVSSPRSLSSPLPPTISKFLRLRFHRHVFLPDFVVYFLLLQWYSVVWCSLVYIRDCLVACSTCQDFYTIFAIPEYTTHTNLIASLATHRSSALSADIPVGSTILQTTVPVFVGSAIHYCPRRHPRVCLHSVPHRQHLVTSASLHSRLQVLFGCLWRDWFCVVL